MELTIKKLTPGLINDYINFFDETPHDDNVDENKCYCVCWCSADHRVATDFSSRIKRRNLAIKYIEEGILQGYLAYDGDRVVGWCNANTKADCLNCTSWLRFMQAVDTSELDKDNNYRIKSIFCFVIAKDMRRKGVAKRLLEYACEDATNDGFDFVEVYPNKDYINESRDFMGPKDLYNNYGFSVCSEADKKLVMRKKLN